MNSSQPAGHHQPFASGSNHLGQSSGSGFGMQQQQNTVMGSAEKKYMPGYLGMAASVCPSVRNLSFRNSSF